VGLLASLDELIAGRPAEGDLVVLVGETKGHLGQSALLVEAFGIEAGDAPPVDLAAERRNGEFVRANRAAIRACTDLSDGGLALAAFEMAESAGLGVTLEASGIAALFGEDQARYLLAVAADDLDGLRLAAQAAGVPLAVVGRFGGTAVDFGGDSAPMVELSTLYRTAFASALGV
jgi:phosphoribosylformylglycinamidine synthase